VFSFDIGKVAILAFLLVGSFYLVKIKKKIFFKAKATEKRES